MGNSTSHYLDSEVRRAKVREWKSDRDMGDIKYRQSSGIVWALI
jgi:hypothetical protein